MAYYGVSIEKGVPWRDGTEVVSNRYFFFNAGPAGAINAGALIDKVAALEKPIYHSTVSFRHGRAWLHVPGNKAASRMLDSKGLSGLGTMGTSPTEIYSELCLLFVWPLGRYGERNREQFMRKWHHVCGIQAFSAAALLGRTGDNSPAVPYTTYGAAIRQFQSAATIDGDYFLETPGGRRPLTDGFKYRFLEHRQFKRGT